MSVKLGLSLREQCSLDIWTLERLSDEKSYIITAFTTLYRRLIQDDNRDMRNVRSGRLGDQGANGTISLQ